MSSIWFNTDHDRRWPWGRGNVVLICLELRIPFQKEWNLLITKHSYPCIERLWKDRHCYHPWRNDGGIWSERFTFCGLKRSITVPPYWTLSPNRSDAVVDGIGTSETCEIDQRTSMFRNLRCMPTGSLNVSYNDLSWKKCLSSKRLFLINSNTWSGHGIKSLLIGPVNFIR